MIAVETIGTCRYSQCKFGKPINVLPTVSLSRRRIFILDDEEPAVDESPTDTIRDRYPDTAATTSILEAMRCDAMRWVE